MTEQHAPIPVDQLLAYHAGDREAAGDAALAARIATDPEARATLAAWQRQDAAIAALYGDIAGRRIPDRLTSAVRRAGKADAWRARWLPVAAILLLAGAAGGYGLARLREPPAPVVELALAARQAHATYAVEVAHPVEVTADNAPHLATWLSKRVGQHLALPDLGPFGLRLLGGRVLPSDEGPAALLMYEDAGGRRVTLYVGQATDGAATALRFSDDGATRSVAWQEDGLRCAVTGDLPREDLQAIARASYEQLT